MTKDLFVSSVTALRMQIDRDRKCSQAFNIILPHDNVSVYDNSYLIEAVIVLLKEAVNDTDDWIDYFVWELDFGRDYKDGCVTADGKNIPLKTADDLWDILKR
jgi:hypothetical protein